MKIFLFPLFALALGQAVFAQQLGAESPTPTPQKKETPAMNEQKTEKAVLGGGCFWCTEALYQAVPGVISVVSGYAGGPAPDPTYEQVSSGSTGHAEVIQIEYDPAKVSYEKILSYFWNAHDPTTLNRQGADHGTQYRSIILYSNDAQKAAAEKSKAEAQKDFKSPIVTEITALKEFYHAEKYHQDYYDTNPKVGYSEYVIEPKLEKFKKQLKSQN